MQTVARGTVGKEGTEKVASTLKEKPIYDVCKRFFDILLSVLALSVLFPVFVVVAVAIKAEDGGDIVYTSTRLTKNGREFKMYKFRSMCMGADKMLDSLMEYNEVSGPVFKIKNDPRVTRVGRLLRKTRIDELPQLWNILKGDMSIIGPRPPLPWEVAQYTPYQMHRLDVKTGLACYHEITDHGENVGFDQWVEEDLEYIRERSILTDLKIILLTIKVVLTGQGAC